MSRSEQQIGSAGQEVAASVLRAFGIELVEKIGTPIHATPVGNPSQHVFRVKWGEKVAGDHHGLLPGGRGVLAETKTILDRNLTWSDFREHQPQKLYEYAQVGGLSLVVWVHSTGVYIMQFPIEGFGPGKGITPLQAQALMERTRWDVFPENREALED